MSAIAEDTVLELQPWVRLRHDRVRGCWVLLAPERVLFPCPITMEVLERMAPGRRMGAILDELAETYEAPRETIRGDVESMLGELLEQHCLRVDSGARDDD